MTRQNCALTIQCVLDTVMSPTISTFQRRKMRFIRLRDLSKVAVTPVQEASYCQDANFRIISRNSFNTNNQKVVIQ